MYQSGSQFVVASGKIDIFYSKILLPLLWDVKVKRALQSPVRGQLGTSAIRHSKMCGP